MLAIFETPVTVTPQQEISKKNFKFFESGVAPANQTKERATTKSSWSSPIFVNSGVFPHENKHDPHWTFVPECPCEKFMNWPFFGLVCRGHSWSKIPEKYLKFTFGNERLLLGRERSLLGERTFTFGDNRGFGDFGNFFFVAGGGVLGLRGSGPRRCFRTSLK